MADCAQHIDLVAVATTRKRINWLIVASVVALFTSQGPAFTSVLALLLIYHLARALNTYSMPAILLATLPVVELFVLLHAYRTATDVLIAHGVRVGIWDANQEDLLSAQSVLAA